VGGGGRIRRAVAVLAVTVSSGVSRADVPLLYGAAALQEDTARAALTAGCTQSDSGSPLNVSLHLLPLTFPHMQVSLRTGMGGILSERLQFSPQEVAVTVPLHRTVLQAGFGYQPVRIRKTSHTFPVIDSRNIHPEMCRLDWYNVDRFRIAANGMTAIGGARYLVYGAAFIKERWSGIRYRQTADFESSYDYVEYRHYGDGDGSTAAQAGFGYWRECNFRERPYKFMWLLEGSVSGYSEALRYNDAIVPLLLSHESDANRYQYNVRAEGMRNREGKGLMRFILSPRFLPLLPPVYTEKSSPVQVTWEVEKVGFGLGAGASGRYYVYIDKSNVFPDGVNYYDRYSTRQGPVTEADHAFRVYGTHRAFGNRAALFGRIVYRSNGQGIKRGNETHASWNGTADLWLGVGSFWHGRVAAELLWKGISSGARLYYYNTPAGKWFDSAVTGTFLPAADVAVNVRMLW
jgi:hypothetical protein